MTRAHGRLVAPAWHTVVLLAALVGFSVVNASMQQAGRVHAGRLVVYGLSIVLEWLFVAFVWLGLWLRGRRLRDLLGDNARSWKLVLRDVGIAVAFVVAANVVLAVAGALVHSRPTEALRRILPHTPAEIATFCAVAATAGICEEIVFRGYLLEQFGVITRSVAGGVVLQAIVFGASHGYEGWRTMIVLALYGGMFGALARWRRSLRPGMIAHALHDAVIGIAAGHFLQATSLLH